MTRTELPARAVNVLRAVGSTATCTSTVVESLKLLLLPTVPTVQKTPVETNVARSETKKLGSAPPRAANVRAKKSPAIAVLECKEERNHDTLKAQDRLYMATEVVNATLKALTTAIKTPKTPESSGPKRRSLPRSSSSASFSGTATPTRCQTPLQPISINRVIQSPAKGAHLRRSSSSSFINSNGVRAQAECARIGLACLRSLQATESFSVKFAALQLEIGMSALISKMLALGFDDLALKELRILRRRIETLASAKSGAIVKGSADVKRKPGDEDADAQKESLPGLLKFTATSLSGPLLGLVTASQIQALKILAMKRHGASVEAALQHLRLDLDYAPANLIERQLDPNQSKTSTNVVHQLEVLAQTIMRMCPKSVEESKKSESRISDQAVFQLQMLAFKTRLRWWTLSTHQPDLEKELIEPFTRCLSTFQRRCSLEGTAKYDLAKDAYKSISTALQDWGGIRKYNCPAISKILAELAFESLHSDEAIQWVRHGLENSQAVGHSASRRSAFLCQLATYRLREGRDNPNDDAVLASLKDAASTLEGDLHGESGELDELLVAVANLRKIALSVVQDTYKTLGSSQVMSDVSGLGQCIQIILISVRFVIRYVGELPPQDAAESKISRYNQRRKLADQVAPSMIDSLIGVARLSVRCDTVIWRRLDTGLQDCLELATGLDTVPISTREPQKGTSRPSPLHVSISQAYWFRFIFIKSTGADAKDLADCLQKSIETLISRPTDEKIAGSLLMKLEKYATLCETSQDYERALKSYEEAIQLNLDAGVVRTTVEAISAGCLSAVREGDLNFELLSRPLSAYPKAASRVNSRRLRTFFDAESLPAEARGLVLERQLTSIIALILNRGPLAFQNDCLGILIASLLSLYTKDELPIRRLHVIVRILHLLSIHPSILAKITLDKFLNELDQQPTVLAGCLDEKLQPYLAHLVSCRDAYVMLRRENAESQVLEPILADWCRLLRRCPDRKSLEQHVYDIPGWLQQLELIAKYLKHRGNESLRTAALHLLVALHEGESSMQCLALASKLTDLGIHYARLGYSGCGGATLQRAQKYIEVSKFPAQFMVEWNAINAEYALLCGNLDLSRDCLQEAKTALHDELNRGKPTGQSIKDRTILAQSSGDLLLIQSKAAMETACRAEAMFFARASVQEYQRIWATLERHIGSRRRKSSVERANQSPTEALSQLRISEDQGNPGSSSKYAILRDSVFWDLSPRLFDGLLHLSRCFAHSGLLPESHYYLEQCQKIADAIHSPRMISTCLTVRGQYAVSSGDKEKGLEVLRQAEDALSKLPSNAINLESSALVALHYMKGGQLDAGNTICSDAMRKLQSIVTREAVDNLVYKSKSTEVLELQLSGLTLEEPKRGAPKKTKAAPKKAPGKPPVQSKVAANPQIEMLLLPDTVPLNSLRADLLRHSALANFHQGLLDTAASQLNDVGILSFRQQDLVMQALLDSQIRLSRGLHQLVGDPVYSILPESTICCPAAILPSEPRSVLRSPPKTSRTAKVAAGKTLNKKAISRDKSPIETNSQHLPLAQKCLSEVYPMAKTCSSTSDIHTITETLSKILTILSVFPTTQNKSFSSSQSIAFILELGRQAAMEQESVSIDVERQISEKRNSDEWPEYKMQRDSTIAHQGLGYDLSTFQADYVDILPKSWTALSITLSEPHEEIWISKIRAGQSPFILRLPFNRENTPDSDEEAFSFDEGKAEMLEVIRLANISAHNAVDLSRKGAKTEWWETRATLDTRLKDLLINIENIWFGGFRGIFSQNVPEPSLLARFQRSLQNILDKHLPSRQVSGKAKQISRVGLDPRVLELFVALGSPSDTNDVEEQLMDLLYFVVDILQFNKERNAYDEIDFDAIVVETGDALRHYHQAVRDNNMSPDNQHTILILDRNLHCFPWESLPCLSGQSVSRLPSLGCLRTRIIRMRKEQKEMPSSEPLEGIYINANHGAYVLNPGGDLSNTQATFEKSLQALSSWESFVEREPSETDMKSCLQDNKLFLYFGHGSGGQYIRSRTIKKLEQCAVALLMGCSSGALKEAGEFEAYGTPINYMHAGSPAVLATLWDVTDRDIDRFSKEVLQKWGLFKEEELAFPSSPVKKSAKQRGKMKVKDRDREPAAQCTDRTVSLDEAVAKSRDSCLLRYLNGAAPVVYGVPVFLS